MMRLCANKTSIYRALGQIYFGLIRMVKMLCSRAFASMTVFWRSGVSVWWASKTPLISRKPTLWEITIIILVRNATGEAILVSMLAQAAIFWIFFLGIKYSAVVRSKSWMTLRELNTCLSANYWLQGVNLPQHSQSFMKSLISDASDIPHPHTSRREVN